MHDGREVVRRVHPSILCQETSMKTYRTVLFGIAVLAVCLATVTSAATRTGSTRLDAIEAPASDGSAGTRAADFARMTKSAAENGNPDAMNYLGILYGSGEGIERDPTAAFYWFLKAIDRGSVDAINNVAKLYFFGLGVPQSYSTAAIWFRRAGSHGSTPAMHQLAVMFEDGLGVDWSQSAAQKYYLAAAEGGYVPAMLALGERYSRGQGVKRDLVLAYAWTAFAVWTAESDRNMDQARYRLAVLRVALSDEKLTRAQMLSAHFLTLARLRARGVPMKTSSANSTGEK
jgi:TPR repeat protein